MKNIHRATHQIFNAPAVFRVQEKEIEEILPCFRNYPKIVTDIRKQMEKAKIEEFYFSYPIELPYWRLMLLSKKQLKQIRQNELIRIHLMRSGMSEV